MLTSSADVMLTLAVNRSWVMSGHGSGRVQELDWAGSDLGSGESMHIGLGLDGRLDSELRLMLLGSGLSYWAQGIGLKLAWVRTGLSLV
ncbi:hypothetical protein V6N13_108756 [Hibiscus sabdariffa]